MKKIIAVFLSLCAFFSLCSCKGKSTPETADKTTISDTSKSTKLENNEASATSITETTLNKSNETTVSKIKSDIITYEDVLRDINGIDYYCKPNTAKLKPFDEYSKKDETTYTLWKDGKGNIIYRYYEGYGDKLFDWYTKSKSGRNITVNFADNDGKRYSITVTCDDYRVLIYDLNKKSPHGADNIEVTVYKKSGSVPIEKTNYTFKDGKWIKDSSYYCDSEGYKVYKLSFDNLTVKKYESTTLLYKRIKNTPTCHSEMLDDNLVAYVPSFAVPGYKLCYLGEPAGAKWYLEADFLISFESEEAKQSYMKKYGLKSDNLPEGEENTLSVKTGNITVPVASDCKNWKEFVNKDEINDSFYMTVTLNKKGEITSMNIDGSIGGY